MTSPAGKLSAGVFTTPNGSLAYTVSYDGRMVCDTSALGVTIDGADTFEEVSLRLAASRERNESYPVRGVHDLARDHAREYVWEVTHRPTGYAYTLETRLYDDGFAYRFILPGQGVRHVGGEAAEWRLPADSRVWFAERNSAWKLLTYAGEWTSAPAPELATVSSQGPVQTMPLLYETADGLRLMVTEAALYEYSGMRLRAGQDGSLHADFTEKEGFDLRDTVTTPWRVLIVAEDLDQLVNTDIVTNLSPAPDPALFADTSWIRPGRSLWSWWSGIDGGFMREAGIQVNELNSGCICCSLVGDFREALKKVVETYHPDRILIEPSGVGKLSDVTRAVEGVAEDLPVILNSFVTVADVNKVKMYMKNFGEFYDDQVSHASCIILSRTGNASEEKVAAAVALLAEKNPTATIVTTDWTVLTGAQIVSVMDGKRDLVAELLTEARAANVAHADEDEHEHHHHHHHDHDEDEHDHDCCCHHHHDEDDDEDEHEHHHHDHDDDDHDHDCCHHHDDEHEHEHHHEHHYDEHGVCSCGHHHHHDHDADEVFTSWGKETAHKYSREDLDKALHALDEGAYGMILRAKGIVDGGDTWYEFDMVPGEHEIRPCGPDVTGKLCVIGSQLKEHEIAELFHV